MTHLESHLTNREERTKVQEKKGYRAKDLTITLQVIFQYLTTHIFFTKPVPLGAEAHHHYSAPRAFLDSLQTRTAMQLVTNIAE